MKLDVCELTIARQYGAENGDLVRIEAKHGLTRIAVIDVPIADFARAVMGTLVGAKATNFAETMKP